MDQVYRIIKLRGAGDKADFPLISQNQIKKTKNNNNKNHTV
jgi:hypothetical protein